MKRFKFIDFRIVLGAVLILGGLLLLVDKIGLFPAWLKAGDLFWGIVTGVAGLAFLYIMISDRGQWWAAFPAFALLGISASAFLPASLEAWTGLAFMTGLSLGFWVVYIADRSRWWAIIPAGILLTSALLPGWIRWLREVIPVVYSSSVWALHSCWWRSCPRLAARGPISLQRHC